MAEELEPGKSEPTKPERIFVKYIGRLVNGIILSTFGNREIYPGETLLVRGPKGIPYATAFSLVRNGHFVWCDEQGAGLEDAPEPLEAEIPTLLLVDPQNPHGDPNRVYPQSHGSDPRYAGPVVGEISVPDVPQSPYNAQAIAQTKADADGETEEPIPASIVVPAPATTVPGSSPASVVGPRVGGRASTSASTPIAPPTPVETPIEAIPAAEAGTTETPTKDPEAAAS